MDGLSLGSINLIVLPLLGGYWFLYKFAGTHYHAERLTPQRLVFHAGLSALYLVAAARCLVYGAEASWNPESLWIEILMFSAIPAFVALVLLSLLMNGVNAYGPTRPRKNAAEAEFVMPPQTRLPAPTHDLIRQALGMLIGAILVIIAVFIGSAIRVAAPIITVIIAVALFGALLVVVFGYCQFISRYIEFPFFSLGLRIGLFGVIASLSLATFLFNYNVIRGDWIQMVNVPGSGIPTLACLLGLVLWWPLNLLYPYQAANMRLHEKHGTTALDRLLYRASLLQHLLSLSMKDGKVYIGYVQELPPNPEERNSYFEILPVASGYRANETHEMKLTTFYESVYEEMTREGVAPADWLIFLKVLKVEDILSAGRFDPHAYVKFQNAAEVAQAPDAADDGSG